MTDSYKTTLSVLIFSLFSFGIAGADSYKERTICDNATGTCWDLVIDNQTAESSKKAWNETLGWIDDLNNSDRVDGPYKGYSDWRLPFSDDPYLESVYDYPKFDNNIHSELGYLFYSGLLDDSDQDFFEGFTYWMGAAEWDETDSNWTISDQLLSTTPPPVNATYNYAWRFDFAHGVHFLGDDNSLDIHAVAIRSYAIPEPSTGLLLLLGVGLLTHIMRNRKSAF